MSSVSPRTHDQYWLGGQAQVTTDQRPLSFFVAEFGPTCLATHDKWFFTFSKISTKSLDLFISMFNKLTFSSRVSSRIRHRLQIFHEIYVVTFSNPGVHLVPKIYKENHYCQRHYRPGSFAKQPSNYKKPIQSFDQTNPICCSTVTMLFSNCWRAVICHLWFRQH